MFEWMDSLSPWWYVAGATAILSIAWMIYECQRAPVIEKDERPFRNLPTIEQLFLEIDRLIAELGQLDIQRSEEDTFLLTVQLEELLQQLGALRKSHTKKDSTKQ